MAISETHRPADQDQLFGHPRGLTFLFTTEMWERFSYYGMRALLVLYMTKFVLLPENADNVLGLAALRRFYESIFGPLGVQPFSSHIYGLYTALVYLTPLFGGMLADRVLGQRRTVVLGASLMAIGHFMMAFESLFLIALLVLIFGNGAFKPNITVQIGSLYERGDPRRDRAYSIFYVGINLGALLAPLVCGTLGELVAWHYGFTAAGVGMVIALLVYLYAAPSLPADERARAETSGAERRPLGRGDWRAIVALIVLLIPVSLFWATYEQQGNTIPLWADDYTDRHINLLIWRGEIPVTWFQSFNPLFIFLFTPLILMLWARQAARGTEPSTVTKMAIGCFGVTFANLIMVGAVWQAGGAPQASWLWLIAYFVVITLGELFLSPIGLSLVSKVSPGRVVSTMMGVWFLTSFFGNLIGGWLGSFWSVMDKSAFFLMIAGVSAVAGLVILMFNRPLRAALGQ
ncbi:MAG: peptide MFS transporter [Xanthobacteraceae bacterium]|nr:peptide MFS transporter [Xanthobacteraceae bacterium]